MSESTREKIDNSIQENLGARLLKRFKADETKEIDLGFGDVITLKVPRTFHEYSILMEQAKTRYKESGQEDENFIYVYLLEAVVANLNAKEIEEIVFTAPGLAEIILKSLDQACGNVISRLETEAILEAKKELRKTPPSEPA